MEQIDLQIQEPPKKNNIKSKVIVIIAIGVVALIVAIVLIAVFAGKGGGFSNEKLAISDATMSVNYSAYTGYSATIRGVAENKTGRDLSYASIEFSVYDADGNNLGTALANINNLAAGDKWSFEAVLLSFPSTRPATFKVVEITTM